MWTVNEDKIVNQCKNVYGTGYCAGKSTAEALTTFTTSVTTNTAPPGFTSPTSPAWGITGYGTTLPIPIYTPAAFWRPVSSGVASGSTTKASSVASSTSKAASVSSTVKVTIASSTSTHVASSSAKPTSIKASSSSPSPSASATIPKWGQCGGYGWDPPATCVTGTRCEVQNEWYSQCL